MCVVKGCGRSAVVVDHVDRNKPKLACTINDLRSLCRPHDNMVKENAKGERRSGGTLAVKGTDANGRPIDPNHAWNK